MALCDGSADGNGAGRIGVVRADGGSAVDGRASGVGTLVGAEPGEQPLLVCAERNAMPGEQPRPQGARPPTTRRRPHGLSAIFVFQFVLVLGFSTTLDLCLFLFWGSAPCLEAQRSYDACASFGVAASMVLVVDWVSTGNRIRLK